MKRLVSFDSTDFAGNGLDVRTQPSIADRIVDGRYLSGAGGGASRFAAVQRATTIIPATLVLTRAASVGSQLETARRLLHVGANDERALVGQVDDGTAVSVSARTRTLALRTPGVPWVYDLVFEAADGDWRAVTPATSSVTGPVGAGGTLSLAVTPAGTTPTAPLIRLTPQKAKTSGTTWTTSYTLTEQDGLALSNVPATITINHAALVTAGHSLAAGTDVLVTVGGTPVERTLTGANTATCRVTFRVPALAASGTATVAISTAAAGQSYGQGGYAEAFVTSVVTERAGAALADYPFQVTFDHAAQVTATRSKASGADLRVLVDGVEVDRAVAGANTASCKLTFPLAVSASGKAVVAVLMSHTGYDYEGGAYAPGSLDPAVSTNTAWAYTTPGVDGADLPGRTKALSLQVVGGYSLIGTNCVAEAATDPDVNTGVPATGGNGLGNYLRFTAGGVPIASVGFAVDYWNTSLYSIARVASTIDGSTWSSNLGLQAGTLATRAYATQAVTAGATAVALGCERASSNAPVGSNHYAKWHGTGATELTLNLDGTKVPAAAAATAPGVAAGSEQWAYALAGSLSDGTRTLAVVGLTLQHGDALALDADARAAWVERSGVELAGSATTARAALSIDSPDGRWLALEPGVATTLTWTEAGMDASGMTLAAEVRARWR